MVRWLVVCGRWKRCCNATAWATGSAQLKSYHGAQLASLSGFTAGIIPEDTNVTRP